MKIPFAVEQFYGVFRDYNKAVGFGSPWLTTVMKRYDIRRFGWQ